MHGFPEEEIPLGLPDQFDGLATSPVDRGDDTQDRFAYQWAMGVVLLVQALRGVSTAVAIWCEHHDDFLLELSSGRFRAIQIKTNGAENAVWVATDAAFVRAVARFTVLEKQHGAKIEQYEFCSNAPVFVPSTAAESQKTLMSSPMRLRECCREASAPHDIPSPYDGAFKQLVKSTGSESDILFIVLKKLQFRRGPPLRGYLDTLIAKVIPILPDCESLAIKRLGMICNELMRLVETASGIVTGGLDGVLAYIEANGRPAVSLRGKCITVDSARVCVENARQSAFRFIGPGPGLPLGKVKGQRDVLRRKMRNAFIDGQFESIWTRAISTEQRLFAKALDDAENFNEMADQLEGVVLTECKDIEALAGIESDERKRGPLIYRTIIERLGELARHEPSKVCNEPKDTLLGVAGMLSGDCRFAWGVPLSVDDSGDSNGA